MSSHNRRIVLGIALIVAGFFFLLDNFRLLGDFGNLVEATVFGVIGLLFIGAYLSNRRHWWPLFPAAVLLGIAGTSVAEQIPFLRPLSGGIFLLFLSLAFWAIFADQRRSWWAVIPAGVLTTLAFTSVLDEFVRGDALTGSLFFIGTGLTFGVLWLIRHNSDTGWAIWPATILIAFGIFLPATRYFDRLWPFVLIAVGLWMLWRNLSHNAVRNRHET